MNFARRILPALAITGAAALALTGCSASTPTPQPADDGRVSVVAVTDVYGDIAKQIGGDLVDVVSIVSGPAVDPHEYEASTRDQLQIAEADLVIVNGGGFDDFMDRLIDASGTAATVIVAVEVSGLLPEDAEAEEEHEHAEGEEHHHIEGFNEHVWYSLHAVEHIAEAIEAALVALDPEGATQIEANAADFLERLDALHTRAHDVEAELGGGDIVATEPVSAYLLADLGLTDVTPEAFLAAVEEGTGVGVGLLDEVLSLFDGHGIRMLAENVQSGGLEAEQVRAAAIVAGVPVVAFSETLPSGEDYLSWMAANIEAVASALR
ncbi:MAG TPA: zinc ABC transporter substrate-binding protein [Microbacteriaceae bacterium]|nr:zinc ABC transporter substrate-binding protein [Microbacteriaceae bacterium]